MVTHPARTAVRYMNDPQRADGGRTHDEDRRTIRHQHDHTDLGNRRWQWIRAATLAVGDHLHHPHAGQPDEAATGTTRTAGVFRREHERWSAERPGVDGRQLTSTSGRDLPAPPPGNAIEEKCETTRSSVGSSAGVWCTASRL